MGTKPLSCPSCAEASLCRREAGEKEKESARGTMGRGKREERLSPFPSSHCARALSIFPLFAIFIGIASGNFCGGGERNNTSEMTETGSGFTSSYIKAGFHNRRTLCTDII